MPITDHFIGRNLFKEPYHSWSRNPLPVMVRVRIGFIYVVMAESGSEWILDSHSEGVQNVLACFRGKEVVYVVTPPNPGSM